jgi:plasmid stabilization system protein ParE
MRRLRWSRRAVHDLLEIGDFIAEGDPRAARRWVERLRARAALAAVTPMAGRVVPELNRDDVCEVFVRSYRIVYQVLPREVTVLTVFEGHRRFPLPPDVDEPDE